MLMSNLLFLRCKNFFKRSVVVVQTKPYVCANQQSCDMSGLKRKGARCQACRYVACLEAGMYHSGYPRTRGGRHRDPLPRPDLLPHKLPRLEGAAGAGEVPGQQQGGCGQDWEGGEGGAGSWDQLGELLSAADRLAESVVAEDLERERSLNRELTGRLAEKETQLAACERQVGQMETKWI